MARLKKGDPVVVVAGKYKNTRGNIVEMLGKNDRVRVEGVAVQKRHLKPQKDSKHPEGGIIEKLGSVHISNVMLWSESQMRGCRVGSIVDENGKKRRVARGKGVTETID